MVRQDLVDYIKSQFQKGLSKEDINKALVAAGWRAGDIEDAFNVSMGINNSVPENNTNTGSLPGAGALLGEAWELYRPRIKTFAGIIIIQVLAMIAAVIVMIVLGIIFGAGSSVFGASAANLMPPPSLPPSDPANSFLNIFSFTSGFIIIFLVILVPMIIIQIWGQAAMIYAIKDSAENIGAVEAYRRSRHKIGSLFWTGFLSFIIIAGGFMLFAVPGIIFAVWFMFASFIVISEDIGGMNALLKSREYIRGRGWEVLGLILVMFLIWFGISIGAQFGLGIISIIFTALGLGFVGLIFNLFIWIAIAIVAPLMTAYSYLIYKHLRRIKGEFAFAPSSGSKIKFIAIGILGIAVGVAVILVPFFIVSVLGRWIYN